MRIKAERKNPFLRGVSRIANAIKERYLNMTFKRDIKRMSEEEKAFAKSVADGILKEIYKE